MQVHALNWKKIHPLSARQESLGTMGALLGAPLKPLSTIECCDVTRGFKGALNCETQASQTAIRCFFSSSQAHLFQIFSSTNFIPKLIERSGRKGKKI